MNNLLIIFAGGGIGSVFRYLIGQWVHGNLYSENFPLGTFLANLMSCLLLAGVLFFIKNESHPAFRLFLITGICGGLSTFSTFGWESVQLIQQGKIIWAVFNIVFSLLLCLTILFWAIQKNSAS